MKAFIKDIAYYLPEKVLTNEQLAAEFPEWSTEKIAGKVGISERHIAAPDETATDMAVAAAEQLFAKGYDRSQIDFLLLCTQSPDYMLPSSACLVQHRLGLSTHCGAFDFNLGCSGYEYGLVMVKSLIQSGVAHNVLLLTSEMYTKYLSQDDKGNRTIFSDGATATWIGTEGFAEIGEYSLGTDGSGAEFLIKRPNEPLYMDGGAIFDFSSDVVPQMVEDVLHKSNLQMDDINLWVFHQANKYMINYIRKMLEIDKERFYIYMEHVGNTVSSTVPIALCAAREEGRLHGNVMLAGFGVGLSWGAALLRTE
ncbi:MAG: ketoacyl-ACP synthase III [Paludibacteraceae bacterium]|nr:ketoacyl-ACP synthase III [Paludibacteraceae bacterium]